MIRRVVKALVPRAARPVLARHAQRVRAAIRRRALRSRLRSGPYRIIVGSGETAADGWIATDADQLDLLREDTWARYLAPASVDALLAEHVWEHFTVDDGKVAARLCHRYLKPGGYIRVAVPDGLYPDPAYREWVGPNGTAGGEPGAHKVLYDYRLLSEVFESAGFSIRLLEYHDEGGCLHLEEWNLAEGMIHRSARFDPKGAVSIILDAVK